MFPWGSLPRPPVRESRSCALGAISERRRSRASVNGTTTGDRDDDGDGDDRRHTRREGKRTDRTDSVWPRAPPITVGRCSRVAARRGREFELSNFANRPSSTKLPITYVTAYPPRTTRVLSISRQRNFHIGQFSILPSFLFSSLLDRALNPGEERDGDVRMRIQ